MHLKMEEISNRTRITSTGAAAGEEGPRTLPVGLRRAAATTGNSAEGPQKHKTKNRSDHTIQQSLLWVFTRKSCKH